MNIMDAKKEFKFKTHTCKIDVLGIEKEINYGYYTLMMMVLYKWKNLMTFIVIIL